MEMREALRCCLEQLMESNPKIVVIDADLAKANKTNLLNERFPTRTFNVGVAEQNMAGVAAGLAAYGFVPFIFSFAPFVTRRICDQLAVSVAYANQNVKVIGTDPGICAELNGGSHMCFEDIAIIRSIPGFMVCEPSDIIELCKMMPEVALHSGPVYIRIPRKEVYEIHDTSYHFNLLKSDLLRVGTDVTLIASGIMVKEALLAANLLKENHSISCEVINLHTIKPIDKEAILSSAKKTGCVVTCENHNVLGGIGSAVAEVLALEYPVPTEFIGIKDEFGEVGRLEELKQRFGLTSDAIVRQSIRLLAKKSGV